MLRKVGRRILKMKITYLKTIGFRKFENEFETDLFDVTSITGGNAKGKTNI